MADPISTAVAASAGNPIIAGVALVGSLLGVIGGSSAKKKAHQASAKAQQARAEITRLENARTRRQQVREARIAAGTALARGATQGGTSFASGTQGEVVGVRSQLGSNLGFLSESSRLNDVAVQNEIKAGKYATRASTLGAAANLGLGIAGLYKG